MKNDFLCADLEKAISNIKEFVAEQQKLDAVISVISPTGTGVVEFGGKFLSDYISLVAKLVGDKGEWVEWFVWENNFGDKGGLVTWNNGKVEVKVKTVKDLYRVIKAKEY